MMVGGTGIEPVGVCVWGARSKEVVTIRSLRFDLTSEVAQNIVSSLVPKVVSTDCRRRQASPDEVIDICKSTATIVGPERYSILQTSGSHLPDDAEMLLTAANNP
jgi:hypothetical protein